MWTLILGGLYVSLQNILENICNTRLYNCRFWAVADFGWPLMFSYKIF